MAIPRLRVSTPSTRMVVPVFGWMLCVPSCVGYIECNKIPNG